MSYTQELNLYYSATRGNGALNLGEIAPSPAGTGDPDGLPEYTKYRDDGCDLYEHCLECGLPACRFDLPPKRAGSLKREGELQELLNAGKSLDEAAVALGVSRRTAFRLKRQKATRSLSTPEQALEPSDAPVRAGKGHSQ